jgi:hypothetical protein
LTPRIETEREPVVGMLMHKSDVGAGALYVNMASAVPKVLAIWTKMEEPRSCNRLLGAVHINCV